jgi:eukaryotic-like serine/threonine-protein kinase
MVRTTAADERAGRKSPNGGYRRLKSIAQGGYAQVFRAEHRERPGQLVAFKRPLGTQLAQNRMAREIDVQRRFDHPHIMPILDAADDGSWFVMPLAQGNLDDLWGKGQLGGDAGLVAAGIIDAVTRGLEPAHGPGYVHRDISPRNVLALPDSTSPTGRRCVVADWGLVRCPAGDTTHRYTQTGEGLGTEGFAAPETWTDGHRVGPEADVYSLGRVVAWLLTGKWPVPNVTLLPDGPLRGLVADGTEPSPARRTRTVRAARERLGVLQAAPLLSPRVTVADLVQQAYEGAAVDVGQILALARQHPDDGQLYLDELARLPYEALAGHTRSAPEETAEVATIMLRHLIEDDWGRRQFDYANTPLGWTFTVLRTLLADDYAGLAEDLATEFFRAEQQWDRWPQLNETVRWLKSLPESRGAVMARAIRRAGGADYYNRQIGTDRVVSRSLAAELGL